MSSNDLKSSNDLASAGFNLRCPRSLLREVPAWYTRDFAHADPGLGRNIYVEHPDGGFIELEDSRIIAHTALLNDDLVLGECYGFLYSDTFLVGDQPVEAQLVLWDRRTGQRKAELSGHFGEILGWQWYGEGRIFTWARDFLIRIWDLSAATQINALPMPLISDGLPPINILDSREFCKWPGERRQSYLDHGGPALAVTHILISPDGADAKAGEPCIHPAPKSEGSQETPASGSFQELKHEEYSYAETATLSDGRLLVSPTTYGARGCCYVWDQAQNLTLLLGRPLYNGVSFLGLEETAPGVVTIKQRDAPAESWQSLTLPSA